MHIDGLPQEVQTALIGALKDLDIKNEELGFWEVSDYGIFVLMTESFYKKLNYRRADPAEFHARRARGELPHAGSYADSRAYMSVLINHFQDHGLSPHVIDIGGYIGRFSLETALLLQKQKISVPIYCLEPGLTGNVIRANFAFNGVEKLVTLRGDAASDMDATADYKYMPDVLISGRICSFPSATSHRTVKTTRLDTLLREVGCSNAAIIKIDTEGHEPNVLAGLGKLVHSLPNVCIVEFWPETLKSVVNGINYADYIEQNFTVLDIKSSLYPRHYLPIQDIREFARNFSYEAGNVDLMFVSHSVPNAATLLQNLKSLGRGLDKI